MLRKGQNHLAFLLIAFPSCSHAQPSADEQSAIISRTRESALAYAGQLQDFLCVQTTVRSVDFDGTGKHWKRLETREVEIAYVAKKEKYRLLSVNGKIADPEKRVKKGYFVPGGEFGSSLLKIFNPIANAAFTWDHEEPRNGKRVCAFRYEVPLASTTLVMHSDLDNVPLAHHGSVYADCDTGAVLRFQTTSDKGSVQRGGLDLAIGLSIEVQYSPAKIGDKEFLLPRTADEIATFGKTRTRAEITFDRYRKYEASSTVTFDDPKP